MDTTLIILAVAVVNLGLSAYVIGRIRKLDRKVVDPRVGYIRGEAKKVSAYGVTVEKDTVDRRAGNEFKFPGKETPGFTNNEAKYVPSDQDTSSIDEAFTDWVDKSSDEIDQELSHL